MSNNKEEQKPAEGESPKEEDKVTQPVRGETAEDEEPATKKQKVEETTQGGEASASPEKMQAGAETSEVKDDKAKAPAAETAKEDDKSKSDTVDDDGDDLQLDEPEEGDKEEEDTSANVKTPIIVIFGLPVILPPSKADDKLHKFLSKYGTIKTMNLKTAFASRYCSCEYEEVADAQKASKAINGRKLMGKTLFVKSM